MDATVLRDQLLKLLDGGNAHVAFQDAVADFPIDMINSRAPDIPYTPWELIEHMRIAQRDIIDFIKTAHYVERKWPDEYWPRKGKRASAKTWRATITRFRDDLEKVKGMAADPRRELTDPLPCAPTYTLLREILLVADHNAYHTAQIVVLRRSLRIYRSG